MSHNIYSENNEITLSKLPTYLIYIENPQLGIIEAVPCNNITTAIKIASDEKRICRLFERAGSMGKHWTYLCDISREVI